MSQLFYDLFGEIPSIVDEGYFTKNGFYSTLNNEKCRCKSREEHYKHMTFTAVLIK